MKKFALFLFIFLFLIVSPVSAQTFDSTKAYKDYVFIRSNYDIAYRNYEIKKEAYLKNRTLTLKEEARVATSEMLVQRDDLYRVYLTAIRTKITEVKGLTNDERGGILTKLDGEVIWYTDHKARFIGNETLEELFRINSDTEAHYKGSSLAIIYDSLYLISLGQEVGITNDHEVIYRILNNYLNEKVSQGTLRIDPFNRWFLDIGGSFDSLAKNASSSRIVSQKLYTEHFSLSNTYKKVIYNLNMSVTELKKLNNFMKEFLTAIENQT